MRLLNVETLKLESFVEENIPQYATLSHTWGGDEVTFHDMQENSVPSKAAWSKVLGTVAQAKRHCCGYVWIDTCCIDKTSSAELSEAINSMYQWYRKCKVCFAYLEDVAIDCDLTQTFSEADIRSDNPVWTLMVPKFLKARWFTRGWTLQELIAPDTVIFYDSHWRMIGEKRKLAEEIFEATGIDQSVIYYQRLVHHKSVAQKMFWASRRVTTRTEDIAYCLLGIFDVNMPLLYGEGKKAFIRLQEEIMKHTYDHSLFAWDIAPEQSIHDTSNLLYGGASEGVGILAAHPSAFVRSADIVPYRQKTEPYSMTNKGLQIHLHVLRHETYEFAHTHVAVLDCYYKNDSSIVLALPLSPCSEEHDLNDVESPDEFYRNNDEGLVKFETQQIVVSRGRKIYLVRSGPFWQDKGATNFTRCWIRRSRTKFLGGQILRDPTLGGEFMSKPPRLWKHKAESIAWPRPRQRMRMALYFDDTTGMSFAVLLSLIFRIPLKPGVCQVKIQIVPTYVGSNTLALLKEDYRAGRGEIVCTDFGENSNTTQATFPFQYGTIIVQIERNASKDFILDVHCNDN